MLYNRSVYACVRAQKSCRNNCGVWEGVCGGGRYGGVHAVVWWRAVVAQV